MILHVISSPFVCRSGCVWKTTTIAVWLQLQMLLEYLKSSSVKSSLSCKRFMQTPHNDRHSTNPCCSNTPNYHARKQAFPKINPYQHGASSVTQEDVVMSFCLMKHDWFQCSCLESRDVFYNVLKTDVALTGLEADTWVHQARSRSHYCERNQHGLCVTFRVQRWSYIICFERSTFSNDSWSPLSVHVEDRAAIARPFHFLWCSALRNSFLSC